MPLKEQPEVLGAGIYAIYYTGGFEPYQYISNANRDRCFRLPIYVGKAIPKGARKGNVGLHQEPGPELNKRVKDHAESIEAVENLDINDFYYRYLIVEDIWIPLGESLLITKFSPIWNTLIDGFGNHDPGKGRYNQYRSRWDVLHPGRGWALKCRERQETREEIESEVLNHLAQQPSAEFLYREFHLFGTKGLKNE